MLWGRAPLSGELCPSALPAVCPVFRDGSPERPAGPAWALCGLPLQWLPQVPSLTVSLGLGAAHLYLVEEGTPHYAHPLGGDKGQLIRVGQSMYFPGDAPFFDEGFFFCNTRS